MGDKKDALESIFDTMELLIAQMKDAPSVVVSAVIGTIVDAWARDNGKSDAEVAAIYMHIFEVRNDVWKAMNWNNE